MLKKRRFCITEKEGELLKIALICAIEEVDKIISKEPIAYWKIMKMQLEDLKTKLQNYKWEVEH